MSAKERRHESESRLYAFVRGLIRFEIQVANEALKVIRMDAEQACGFGVILIRLCEGAQNYLLLVLDH